MKLAIVGFELEGKAAYNYWLGQGADVTICDQDPAKDVPDGVDKQLGENYLKDLYRFDLVFRTAGIHPNIILRENPTLADKLTTTMNEFCVFVRPNTSLVSPAPRAKALRVRWSLRYLKRPVNMYISAATSACLRSTFCPSSQKTHG